MGRLDRPLDDVLRRIEPSEAQKDGAKRSHQHLRERLSSGNIGTRVLDSYLSGSYARDTAISPLDDVDIIVVIDPIPWRSGLDAFFEWNPSPSRVLRTFANAIRYRYPDSSLHMQRRSVRLELDHLNLDVVPAIQRGNDNGIIYIGDTEDGEWIKTAPKLHAETTTVVNKQRDGLFKPLVKLVKRWNASLPETAHLRSFVVETIAVRLFQQVGYASLEEGLHKYFDFLAYLGDYDTAYRWGEAYGISTFLFSFTVPDTADTGSNTAAGVGFWRRCSFFRYAARSRDRLRAAMDAKSDETAIARLHEALRLS